MLAQAFEEQDLRIADLVEREGRALVIGMNKWDLKDDRHAAGKLRQEVDHWLPQVRGVPIVAMSGMTGDGLDRLMRAVIDAHAVWNKRVSTSQLNRWFEDTISSHPPPAVSGTATETELHHAGESAAAKLCDFLHARGRCAGDLQALSDQRDARSVRPARHADPDHLAREEKSLRGPENTAAVMACALVPLGIEKHLVGGGSRDRSTIAFRHAGFISQNSDRDDLRVAGDRQRLHAAARGMRWRGTSRRNPACMHGGHDHAHHHGTGD